MERTGAHKHELKHLNQDSSDNGLAQSQTYSETPSAENEASDEVNELTEVADPTNGQAVLESRHETDSPTIERIKIIQNLEKRSWKGIYPPIIGQPLNKHENILEVVLDEMKSQSQTKVIKNKRKNKATRTSSLSDLNLQRYTGTKNGKCLFD